MRKKRTGTGRMKYLKDVTKKNSEIISDVKIFIKKPFSKKEKDKKEGVQYATIPRRKLH